MTADDLFAIMPLLILSGGSVLLLLVGVVRPGGYLYGIAGAFAAVALLWNVTAPGVAVMPGLTITSFSRYFSAFLYGTGLVALLLASDYNRRRGITGEEFPATLLFALTGMGAVCAASNLLMLFIALESFTFAFYILVAIERDSETGGEAGLKYLLNGTLSAALMSMGLALLYCSRGTLKLAELASLPATEPLYLAGSCLILLGLAFKLSLVPAHLWTPDVYQGAPAPVTALLSTASKAATLAALLLFIPLVNGWRGLHDIFWMLALLSVVSGNLAALLQNSIKRMLAWSSIAQMGYVALALTAAPSGGKASAVFYAIMYAAAGLASFGAVSLLSDRNDRNILEQYRGLGYKSPLAGAALAVSLFSLAGIPPTAGFMAKFAVFRSALRNGETSLTIVAILTALVAVFFYLRVVVTLYMKSPGEQPEPVVPLTATGVAALTIPTLITLYLGIYPQPLLDLLTRIMA